MSLPRSDPELCYRSENLTKVYGSGHGSLTARENVALVTEIAEQAAPPPTASAVIPATTT